MWIPMPQGEFKSSDERTVTARAPEALELYQQIIETVCLRGSARGTLEPPAVD
jgi:hypothetical protein